MKRCVVVGGGVVGLLTAYLNKDKFDEVLIVDKESTCGGLLNSFEMNGAIYDYGTHVPAPTGIPVIDEFFYGSEEDRNRNFFCFPSLAAENFFNGTWNTTSPLMDARTLAPEDYRRGLVELLEAPGLDGSEQDLDTFLRKSVGNTFTNLMYVPVVQKMQGAETPLNQLTPEVLRAFGLQRVMALTSTVSRELKQIPRLDDSLGFHSYKEGLPAFPYYYPRGLNGIGKWVSMAVDVLKAANVKFLLGVQIERMQHSNGTVRSLGIEGGPEIELDRLYWTVPAFLAFKAAGIEFVSQPPRFRTHSLCHFEFDKPLLKKESQYLLCWDPARLSYRITLYPNMTPDHAATGRHTLTVEVNADHLIKEKENTLADTICQELKEMEVIDRSAKIITSRVSLLGPGFPVFSLDFTKNVKAQAQRLNDSLKNIVLLGRSSGRGFFINDLLIDAYHTVRGE